MPDEGNKLKLGEGSAFMKRDLRQLPQTKDVWEADFLPLPLSTHRQAKVRHQGAHAFR